MLAMEDSSSSMSFYDQASGTMWSLPGIRYVEWCEPVGEQLDFLAADPRVIYAPQLLV